MTNNHHHQQSNTVKHKPMTLGSRLRNAREAHGFDRKDAAAQLRLSEKLIMMIEKDAYPADLPLTFLFGHLRAYGKLLEIPDDEVNKAIELLKPKPTQTTEELHSKHVTPLPSLPGSSAITSKNLFMQFSTVAIVVTMISLAVIWFQGGSYSTTTSSNDSPVLAMQSPQALALQQPVAAAPIPAPTADKPQHTTMNNQTPAASVTNSEKMMNKLAQGSPPKHTEQLDEEESDEEEQATNNTENLENAVTADKTTIKNNNEDSNEAV